MAFMGTKDTEEGMHRRGVGSHDLDHLDEGVLTTCVC